MNYGKKALVASSLVLAFSMNLFADEVYTIKDKTLKEALEIISKKSNLSYIANDELLELEKTNNIENIEGTQKALDKLLQGTGLKAIIKNEAIVIVKSEVKNFSKNGNDLGSVEVLANSSTTEGTNSYTTGAMRTATKLNLSIKDTPQSVKVLTSEYLEDINIDSYHNMLKNITGVTIGRVDERIFPTARGFGIDYTLFDGIPSTMDESNSELDLSIYDRVEIVKGANGLMTGAGSPAVGINMIRKHANSKEFTGDISVSTGSWNAYGIEADMSTPLNDDGSIRARVVAKYEDEESFLDLYQKTNHVLYGVVDMDLSDTTYLSIGASYQDLDRDGVSGYGLPAFYTDGSRTDFDRSTHISEKWTYWDNEIKVLYADLTQYLYDDIALKISYSHKDNSYKKNWLRYRADVNKETNSGSGYHDEMAAVNEYKEDNFDTYVSLPFVLAGLEQEIVSGVSYNKMETVTNKFAYQGSDIAIDFDNIYIESLNASDYLSDSDLDETVQSGVYLAGKFSLREDLKFIGGLRVSNWKYTNKTSGSGNREFKNELTPYAGLIYDINENHSVYASYTDIFNPQEYYEANGDYLDPKVGRNYEVGLKGEYFDKRLNTAISLFKIKQDNVAEAIDGVYVTGTMDQAYRGVDGVTSEGIEFEMDGEVNDNWNISFGIANFEAKDKDGKKVTTAASRTTANLFTKYKIDKDFSIGGGINYKSKIYEGSGDTKIIQDAYYLVNMMGSYNISKDMKFQVNINNLFDKKYYEGLGSNSMHYGEPRSFTASLKYTF